MGNLLSSLKPTKNNVYYYAASVPIFAYILFATFKPYLTNQKSIRTEKEETKPDNQTFDLSKTVDKAPTKIDKSTDTSTKRRSYEPLEETEIPKQTHKTEKRQKRVVLNDIPTEIPTTKTLEPEQTTLDQSSTSTSSLKPAFHFEEPTPLENTLTEILEQEEIEIETRDSNNGTANQNSEVELIEKLNRRRMNILKEISATEKSYLDSLIVLQQVFAEPMSKEKIIPEEINKIIFNKIKELINIHEKLSNQLEDRIKNWSTNPKLSDLFMTKMSEFEEVYTPYIINYNKSIETFNKTLEISSFEEFLIKCQSNPRCKNLSLQDFLIMPVQRLPRYELLLRDLLKHTEAGNSEISKIEETLEIIKKLTMNINEKKRLNDSNNRIALLNSKQKNKKNRIIKEGRMLVKEGLVLQFIKGKFREIYLFLFNDVVMCSKQTVIRKKIFDHTLRYENEWIFEITEIQISDDVSISDAKGEVINNESCFKISTPTKSVILKCSNPYEKKNWIECISNAQIQANSQSDK